ncbi:MAG: hypothetical protein DRP55_04550 [Spirochaetes bacterium]|nr:MAG: hypothetical protein DRP55_04550 [Spirochaetota bacterium]
MKLRNRTKITQYFSIPNKKLVKLEPGEITTDKNLTVFAKPGGVLEIVPDSVTKGKDNVTGDLTGKPDNITNIIDTTTTPYTKTKRTRKSGRSKKRAKDKE